MTMFNNHKPPILGCCPKAIENPTDEELMNLPDDQRVAISNPHGETIVDAGELKGSAIADYYKQMPNQFNGEIVYMDDKNYHELCTTRHPGIKRTPAEMLERIVSTHFRQFGKEMSPETLAMVKETLGVEPDHLEC